jgi:hypothetical protein
MALTDDLLKNDPRIQEAYANRNRPIAFSEQGIAVARIQRALDRLHYPLPKSISTAPVSGGLDGIFGSETLGAVRKFQLDQGLKVDGMIGQYTLDKLDAALKRSGPSPPVPPPPGPDHATVIRKAFTSSREAVGFTLLRLLALKSELQRIDRLNGTDKLSALTNMTRAFAREIALLALRLFIPANPMSQTFRDTLDKVIDLIQQNQRATSTFKEDGDTGRCTASNFNPPGVPFAASNQTEPDPRVSLCTPFFTSNNTDLQRDVITHEFFHLVGLADVRGVSTTQQALNNANTLAQIVAWTKERSRQSNSDGNEAAIPPLPS